MILTVTLNTSIDKAYFLDEVFQIDKVSRTKSVINTAGGKGLNVSRSAMACGGDVIATGLVGGYNGEYLQDLLRQDKVNFDFAKTKGETRSCINILDTNNTSTEILEPGSVVTEEEIAAFEEKFVKLSKDADVITVSGSLPLGFSNDYYSRLLSLTDKKVLLDTSVKYFKYAIEAHPYFVKPNKDEIEDIFGIKVKSIEDGFSASVKLHKLGIAHAAVSLGAKGAVVTTDDGTFYGCGPDTPCINSVGSGDTFVGAYAVQTAKGSSVEECLRHALAASKANTLCKATGKFEYQTYIDLLDKIIIRKEG